MSPAPYTYVILRYIHDIVAGEFVNVGVALYAPELRFAGARCRSTFGRITRVFPGAEGEEIKALLRFIEARFADAGRRLSEELPFEGMPPSAVVLAHSILPQDDSSLQWSEMGSGMTDDPEAALKTIYERVVLRHDDRGSRKIRSDGAIWRKYSRALEERSVVKHLQPRRIVVADDDVEFSYAWKNGVWHCLEPVSFDLSNAESIRDKAHRWFGQVASLQSAAKEFKVYFLFGEPQIQNLRPAYERAFSMLARAPIEKELIRESEAGDFSNRFAAQIEEHSGQV